MTDAPKLFGVPGERKPGEREVWSWTLGRGHSEFVVEVRDIGGDDEDENPLWSPDILLEGLLISEEWPLFDRDLHVAVRNVERALNRLALTILRAQGRRVR